MAGYVKPSKVFVFADDLPGNIHLHKLKRSGLGGNDSKKREELFHGRLSGDGFEVFFLEYPDYFGRILSEWVCVQSFVHGMFVKVYGKYFPVCRYLFFGLSYDFFKTNNYCDFHNSKSGTGYYMVFMPI
jgi:hypothetical protein